MAGASQHRNCASEPVAGYLGHLGDWVDLELLAQTASACPEVRFEIVGPVDAASQRRLRQALEVPNLRHSPAVSETAIPDVLGRFSIGLIPFRVDAFTRAVNPNKLYEYAAFDLPIVSTPFSPEIAALDGVIHLGRTPPEFAAKVKRASQQQSGGTRALAESHAWETLAEEFARLIRTGGRQGLRPPPAIRARSGAP
jgi:glycosyltransferase involved in cell wall biosynthesis